MPLRSQLGLVYQSQWFWLLLVLAAIYFFVGHGIVPKVEATVDQRDAQLAADLADATRLRAEARKTALAEIEGLATDAARDIAAKLTGAKVDEKAGRAAVAGALSNA